MKSAGYSDFQLWEKMETAFDSCVDDCFYEFNEAASAMLNCIAGALEQAIDADGTVEDVTNWLRLEALMAFNRFKEEPTELPF